MDIRIFPSPEAAVRQLAGRIAALIRRRADEGRHVVLGLATGRTPLPLYAELICLHRGEDLSFTNVITFNLDEYEGLHGDHPRSYRTFMNEHLFDHVDVRPENIHIPDGMTDPRDMTDHCHSYERAIRDSGGIDLQILGIGRTGHIGFNEPGSGRDSRTRLVELDDLTRNDAASDFGGMDNVPRHAITMGCGTILAAREIALLAWGEGKASILERAFEGAVSDDVPASFLREHGHVTAYLDAAAASHLSPVMPEKDRITDDSDDDPIPRSAYFSHNPIPSETP